jgi:hypothetical protein
MYWHFPRSFAGRSVAEGWPRLVGTVKQPGRTASGLVPTTTLSGGGLWAVNFAGIFLRTRDDLNLWESLTAYLAEGARPIIVPFCVRKLAPVPIEDGVPVYARPGVPHSDGTFFSDRSGYVTPAIIAAATADAALRATTIRLTMTTGGPPAGLFSIHHDIGPRPYRILEALAVDGVPGDYDVRIEPPLREDVTAGSPAEFDWPACVMQLAGGEAMTAPADMLRFARGSASFIESFLPEPA